MAADQRSNPQWLLTKLLGIASLISCSRNVSPRNDVHHENYFIGNLQAKKCFRSFEPDFKKAYTSMKAI
jgi:hypothetical protein